MLSPLAFLLTGVLLGALPVSLLWLRARWLQRNPVSASEPVNAARWSCRLPDHFAESVIVLDGEGVLRFATPSLYKLLGVETPALLGRNMLDFVHPQEHGEIIEVLQWLDGDAECEENVTLDTLGVRSRLYSEQRLSTRAGWCWFGWSYTRLPAGDGADAAIIGVGRDISARRRVEQELRQVESILAAVGDPVSFVDTDYIYRYVNAVYERVFGKPRSMIVGHHVADMLGEGVFSARVKPQLDRCFDGEIVSYDAWFELQPGAQSFMSVTYRPCRENAGRVIGAAVIGRDNSALRRARDQTGLALGKFRILFEHFPLGILVVDAAGFITEANPVAHRLLDSAFGRYQGRHIEESYWRLVDANQQPFPIEHSATVRAFRERRVVTDEVVGCPRSDGSVLWLNATAAPLPGSDQGVVVVLEDISMRIAAEAAQRALVAMRESERRFRIMADGVPLILWVADQQGRLEFVNGVFRQFFGLGSQASEQLRDLWPQLLHREDLPAFQQRLAESAQPPCAFEMACRVRRGDGAWRWMQVSAAPHHSSTGEVLGLVGAMQDINARRRAEAQVRKSRDQLRARAEQLARLTLQLTLSEQQERLRISRLLHDHLQQDMVAVKFQLAKLASNPRVAGEDGLAQAKALIDQAIATGRTLNADLNPPLLHQGSFGNALAWLAQGFGERHGLEVCMQVEHDVWFEREELRILLFESVRELLLNVVKHAETRDALLVLDVEHNEQVLVRVEDSGRGFTPDSGATDQNMGLGLVAIRERITLLGGTLAVHSGEGVAGTSIVLRVPLSEGSKNKTAGNQFVVSGAGTHGQQPVLERRRTIRIVLVDDHVMVRQALASLINDEPDMRVVGEASDGFEAIEMVNRKQPDVVVMDVSMPELNGAEATRVIRARWSQVRVIGLSVQEDQSWVEEMLDAGAEYALSKADVSEALLDCLREIA
ncbi:PAS domain-containing protein [Thiorhodovibrio frisius]|uniref:PAS domain S-box n=1 Tax=Thiorhodovibrio frisius TaxID=631362 RepID=H8Z0W9_9GAMM|nr:PAS domain-containing protein [Thiorhodovibrio frisius]EIC21351.1 PAS domain S-box [Thiorhodovibrio frisius]WPL23936.1 Protease production enhancer protein [Thiorhodovibrio frisius]